MKDTEAALVFTDRDFDTMRALFTSLTGNKLGPEKRTLLESRLRKRLHETGLAPKKYLDLLESDQGELETFISSLTTHKTDWFREPQHFDFFKRIIASRRQQLATEPLSIWSAASSTGEEIYSLGMTAIEEGVPNVRILGTDISTSCLEKARAGVYSKDTVDRQVHPALKQRYFLRGISPEHRSSYRVTEELRQLAKWRVHNLVESELPSQIEFDFIFLRNVLIYFDAETAFEVVRRLKRYMKKDGFLVVGLSENVLQAQELGLKRVDNSIYRK